MITRIHCKNDAATQRRKGEPRAWISNAPLSTGQKPLQMKRIPKPVTRIHIFTHGRGRQQDDEMVCFTHNDEDLRAVEPPGARITLEKIERQGCLIRAPNSHVEGERIECRDLTFWWLLLSDTSAKLEGAFRFIRIIRINGVPTSCWWVL